MTIIDSANMQCNGCGVSANHPIMFMPDGWIVDYSTEPIQHLCSTCKGRDNHKMIKIIHGYHTTNDPCKGPVPCRMCGVTVTSEDHWASDEDKWFYCEQCWKNIEAKELLPSRWSITDYQTMTAVNHSDSVNHPSHYTSHPSGVECIQITEWMSFNIGNAVKYLWRVDEKGSSLEDLEKAAWYINREIERRKRG